MVLVKTPLIRHSPALGWVSPLSSPADEWQPLPFPFPLLQALSFQSHSTTPQWWLWLKSLSKWNHLDSAWVNLCCEVFLSDSTSRVGWDLACGRIKQWQVKNASQFQGKKYQGFSNEGFKIFLSTRPRHSSIIVLTATAAETTGRSIPN